MQQLQNASELEKCAAGVLEAVLEVLLLVRENNARRQGGGGAASLMHARAMGVIRKRPGATLSALSAQLALTLSATSRLAEALSAKGLISRTVPAGNRRTVALHLTPAGHKVLARALAQARQSLSASLRRLTRAQRRTLAASMRALHDAIAGA
jgi:DNA-binding MarR family transcriptional regulator